METVNREDDHSMELPPGFRFHPTDEELITHYLTKKVLDCSFSAVAIGEVDMNKVEPWELPWRAKLGEKEWYFFCVRDRKYPTGRRTNRTTATGYWKATGKDKEIFRGRALLGMKKTLVFYQGRAPKGEKSNWVSHEYRLEDTTLPVEKSSKNDWVISRVFQKSSCGQNVLISGLDQDYGHCFSDSLAGPERVIQGDPTGCFGNLGYGADSFPLDSFSKGEFGFPAGLHSGVLTGNMNQGFRKELETGIGIETGTIYGVSETGKKMYGGLPGAQHLDCIWSC